MDVLDGVFGRWMVWIGVLDDVKVGVDRLVLDSG